MVLSSLEWFSPTYTELAVCLEMYGQVKNLKDTHVSVTLPEQKPAMNGSLQLSEYPGDIVRLSC